MTKVPTLEQIKERLALAKNRDPIGDEYKEYLFYTDFETIKPYCSSDVSDDKIRSLLKKPDRQTVLDQMKLYVDFAWDKANNCRGLSAQRSLMHYVAWTFLAGDIEFSEKIQHEYESNYQYYGKDILTMICKYYGWDCRKLDDGYRVNSEAELEAVKEGREYVPPEPAYMKLENERYWVSQAMIKFGADRFMNHLGYVIAHADMFNQVRIKNTFPAYWQEYLEIGKRQIPMESPVIIGKQITEDIILFGEMALYECPECESIPEVHPGFRPDTVRSCHCEGRLWEFKANTMKVICHDKKQGETNASSV